MVEILEHMSALSDQTRCRMLLLLERHELTVSELCAVLQMPQSSVSRQLKTLADDDWITSRRDATSRYYTMPLDDLKATLDRSFKDEMWSKDGMISKEAWATGSAVVREAGILKTDVKYEEIIDMSFVESVRASL